MLFTYDGMDYLEFHRKNESGVTRTNFIFSLIKRIGRVSQHYIQ